MRADDEPDCLCTSASARVCVCVCLVYVRGYVYVCIPQNRDRINLTDRAVADSVFYLSVAFSFCFDFVDTRICVELLIVSTTD